MHDAVTGITIVGTARPSISEIYTYGVCSQPCIFDWGPRLKHTDKCCDPDIWAVAKNHILQNVVH